MTEYKAGPAHELKLDDKGTIEAAFAQLNVIDADGDVTLPGAFPSKEVPMSAYGHTSWDGALPVGKGTISEEGDWAVFKGQMFLDTTAGRDAHATLKGLGPLAEFSYGYEPTDFSFGEQAGQKVRYLKLLDVFEVSNVLRGAGVGTHLRALKGGAPGPEMPWAERLSWYVDSLSALLDHGKARQELRASEGRKLSRTDRARLEDLEVALNGHLAAIHELLLVPEDPKAAQRRLTTIMVEVELARMLGVPV